MKNIWYPLGFEQLARVIGIAILGLGTISFEAEALTYGKLRGGIGYAAAKEIRDAGRENSVEAGNKITQADDLANHIADTPDLTRALNSNPDGMPTAEVIFEMLNAVDDRLDKGVNIKISDADRASIMHMASMPIGQSQRLIWNNFKSRFNTATRMLKDAKIVNDKAVKQALISLLQSFTRFDGDISRLFLELQLDMTEIQGQVGVDAAEKFRRKLKKIKEYIGRANNIVNAYGFNFRAIFGQKLDDAHAAQLRFRAATGDGVHREAPNRVNMTDSTSHSIRQAELSITLKKSFGRVIALHFQNLFNQLKFMKTFLNCSDEMLKEHWKSLVDIMNQQVGPSDNSFTLRELLLDSGIFFAVSIRSINFQQEMYRLLDDQFKLGNAHAVEDPVLAREHRIDDPANGSWFIYAVESHFDRLPEEAQAGIRGILHIDHDGTIDRQLINDNRDAIVNFMKAYTSRASGAA